MKPSSRRMRATSAFIRLVGMDTVSCRATAALRTRVRRSATGSFGIPIPFGRTFFGAAGLRAGRSDRSAVSAAGSRNAVISSVNTNLLLPARLRDARQLADQRALAEADPAKAELPKESARPAAHLAAVVHPHRELGRALRFQDEAFLCHLLLLGRGAERHPEVAQKCARLFVRPRRRADRDLHTPQPVDLVVLDLRENELLLETERVVTAAVEALVGHALEVADARERDRDELFQEVPHALAAERDLQPDRHSDTEPEVRDGFFRLRHDRPLSGDLREIAGRRVHGLGVADRLAHADVEDDLLDLRILGRFGLVVLFGDVHAGDAHGLAARPYFLDAPALPAVLARDDHDLVALPKAHAATHQRSSGASETIFMKLRSRSSRATGPKIRVPRGWF